MKLFGTDDVNDCVHCKHPAPLLSPSAIAGVSGGGRAQPPRARIWWPDGAGAWAGAWAVVGTVQRGGGRQPAMRRKGHQGGANGLDGAEGEAGCQMCGYAISFSAFSYIDVEEDGKPFPVQRWNETRAALDG